MKKLFICERPYMLYKSIIKAMLNESDEIDIVLSNHMAGMEKLEQPLRDSQLFHRVYFFDDKLYQEYIRNEHLEDYVKFPKIFISWPKKMKRYWVFHKKAAKEQLPEDLNFKNYDEIYVVDGVSTINLRLNFEKIHYIVSEHARNNFRINYPLHKLAVRISIILDRLNIVVAYSGCSKWVSAIEVSEDSNLVSYIKGKKLLVYDVGEIVKKLTDDQKNKVYEIYAQAYDIKIQNDRAVNVLLTAPLLEDGMLDNKKKVAQCWRNLVEQYGDPQCQLLVKAHPRDKMDYKSIFTNCIVVDPLVTAEVLAFATSLNITKVLNLYSSTVDAFADRCECVTVGVEFLASYKEHANSDRGSN